MTCWWQHFKQAFTPEECNAVVGYGSQFPAKDGKIGHGGETVEHDMRKSIVRWIPRMDINLQFLFDRLVLKCLQANHLAFHLELSDYPMLRFGHAQLTEYHAQNEGKYDWHEDNCWISKHSRTHDRKISCVLQLTPPEQYEGGKLELERDNLTGETFTKQGDLIFFPSHLRHRVTPVTKGVRHSLVVWFEGPVLR